MPAPAVSSHTWRNLPPSHMGKWIAHPRKVLGRQRPPDSDRPQEVSSLQTPPSSIRFRAFKQGEFCDPDNHGKDSADRVYWFSTSICELDLRASIWALTFCIC